MNHSRLEYNAHLISISRDITIELRPPPQHAVLALIHSERDSVRRKHLLHFPTAIRRIIRHPDGARQTEAHAPRHPLGYGCNALRVYVPMY